MSKIENQRDKLIQEEVNIYNTKYESKNLSYLDKERIRKLYKFSNNPNNKL
jgi:hypothetical protein